MKKLIKNYNHEILIFLSLSVNFIILFMKDELIIDILYPMHLTDIRAGFISRTLIGSISGLIWKHPTKDNVAFFLICANLLTFFLISVYIGKCIKKAPETNKKELLFLTCFIAVFPYGFMTFTNLFDFMDIFWCMSAVLILLCAEKTKLRFFIPVFVFFGLWTHYAFLLTFMPLVYILCINMAIKAKDKKTYTLLGIMIVSSVGFSLYFLLSARNLAIPFDDFKNMIINKAGDKITNFENYMGTTFAPAEVVNKRYHFVDPSAKSSLFNIILGNFKYTFSMIKPGFILADVIFSLPVFIFFEKIFIDAAKRTEDKLNRFPIILTIITPGVTLVSILISTITSRWIAQLFIVWLLVLAMFLYEKNDAVSKSFTDMTEKLKKHKIITLSVICIYLSIVFIW